MDSTVDAVRDGSFSAQVRRTEGVVLVELCGTADSHVRETFQRLLGLADEEARRAGVNAIVVDFCKLEFMSSSCFKACVSWLDQARQIHRNSDFRIRLLSSSGQAWHRRSLSALRALAPELVTVDVQ